MTLPASHRRIAPIASRSMMRPAVALLSLSLPFLGACAIVRQDEIGVRTTLGRITSGPQGPGAQFIIPGVNSVLRVPGRVVNREVLLELPSREGLNVAAEVSILYRVIPDSVPSILARAGREFEQDMVIPVFRSSSADVASQYMAKDMHSGSRIGIEAAIRTKMMEVLASRGIIVENVLLKSIRLPADLARAVEQKLEAEQRSEQMRFVLDRERQEAERRKIEAGGVRDAQRILAEGLSPMVLSYQSIEAFRELARSPNTKVIITDGKSPIFLGNGVGSP